MTDWYKRVPELLSRYPFLTERDAGIIAGRDAEPPATLGEVGAVFGVTRERIRQLEKLARAKIAEADSDPEKRWQPYGRTSKPA